MKLQSINPHDQSLVGEVEITTPDQITKIVTLAKAAFPAWKNTLITKRSEYIKKYRQLLLDHKEEIAVLVSKEMGKPLGQSRDDVDAELPFLDFYTNEGVAALADETVLKNDSDNFRIIHEPYGVCAVITPWNFPLSMLNSGVIPALISGNTVVVKPTEYATLSQKLFYELLLQTGLPKDVLNLVVGGKDTGKLLVQSDVDLVWFTGSTAAGLDIYKQCANRGIKCLLEMGGSSPGIVFADADLKNTIESLYWARFLDCGQVCSAIKRLYVEQPIYDKFVSELTIRLSQVKLGNPLNNPDLGPLVNKLQLEKLESQVSDAVSKGAKVKTGGTRPADTSLKNGNYYVPTILTNIKPDMRVVTEEVFGPVLPVMSFTSEEEAVQLANQTEYGLTAEVYSSDLVKANRVAKQINAGVVAINTDNFFKPVLPFGGYKKSGLGREYGTIGMREFCQVKVVGTSNH